jgi:hypothetical protein
MDKRAVTIAAIHVAVGVFVANVIREKCET